MDINKRLALIKEVGEEIITEEELRTLLETKKKPIAYDGFEPSGNLHIAQGLLRSINVNKMIDAGCHFKMWVADWFGWMNNKLGGDLEKIRVAGEYMIEVWKTTGMKTESIDFLWAKDVMADENYWKKVVQIARNSTLPRVIRCSQIMGRKESEQLSAAQIFYPCMQAADVFHLEADITQLGMDQKKVNILAREVAPKLGLTKPVIVSHHMLLGLGKPVSQEKDATERAIDLKMSKSRPETAIFMTDSAPLVEKKIQNAYCPEGEIKENPLAEYLKYILFEKFKEIKIERDKKFGGDLILHSFEEFSAIYLKKQLHPLDLKKTVAVHVNKLLEPVRKHFDTNKKAKNILEQVQKFEIT